MKYSLMLAALVTVAGLSACEKSTVVTPAATTATPPTTVAVPTPVPVPGPAGPAGPQGPQGSEGVKGDAGKSGTDTVLVVPGEKSTETK